MWFTCIVLFTKLSKSYLLSDVVLAELVLSTCFDFVFSVSESESDESDDDEADEDDEHNLTEMFIHWNNILLEGFILYLQNMYLNEIIN